MNKKKISVIGLSGLSIFMKCDHFASSGETILTNTFHTEYGGKGYNQAIACARCNLDVSFLSSFGDDEIKDKAISLLEKEHVKVMPIIKKGEKSGAATILIDKNGQNIVNCYPGASLSLTKDDVDKFENEIISSSYLLLQLESSDEALYEALDIAERNNVKVILNPAPAHKIKDEDLKKCYILTPNEQEYKLLFGDVDIKDLEYNIIVTLGDKGCIGKVDNEYFSIKANKVKVKNTTGAGDTFNGILASMLALGYNVKDAAKIATYGASLSVEKEYVIDSIPYYNDLIK